MERHKLARHSHLERTDINSDEDENQNQNDEYATQQRINKEDISMKNMSDDEENVSQQPEPAKKKRSKKRKREE